MSAVAPRREAGGIVWCMAALMLAEIVSPLEFVMVFGALPAMQREFGDPIGVGWVVTVFFLVSAGAAAVGGRLGDIYGRKRVLVVVLALAGLGSTISALGTLPTIIAGWALQGVSAAILPLAIGIIRETICPHRVPLCIGLVVGAASAGSGLALLVAGLLVDHVGWRWIFWAPAVVAVAAALGVALLVPATSRGSGERADFVGGLLFLPALAGVLYGATELIRHGFGARMPLALLVASLAVLGIWARYELRHPDPLIDLRLFRNRRIALGNLVIALMAIGSFNALQVVTNLFQQPSWTGIGLGVGATVLGVAKLPAMGLAAVAPPFVGRLAQRKTARTAMILGVLLMLAGWSGVAALPDHLAALVISLTCIYVAATTMYTASAQLVAEAAPENRTSEAVGLTHLIRSSFAAVGTQVIAGLMAFDTISRDGLVYPTPAAFRAIFAFVFLGLVGALVAAIALPRKQVPEAPLRSGALR